MSYTGKSHTVFIRIEVPSRIEIPPVFLEGDKLNFFEFDIYWHLFGIQTFG